MVMCYDRRGKPTRSNNGISRGPGMTVSDSSDFKIEQFGLAILLAILLLAPAKLHAAESRQQMDAGARDYQTGSYGKAIAAWEEARKTYATANNANGQIDAAINIASAYQMLGRYDLSVDLLDQTLPLTSKDASRKAAVLNCIGSAVTMDPEVDSALALLHHNHHHAATRSTTTGHDALQILNDALALATQARDDHLRASILNNLGNLYLTRGSSSESGKRNYQEATRCYRECVDALGDHDGVLAAKAHANAAVAASRGATEARAAATTRASEIAEAIRDHSDGRRLRAEKAQAANEQLSADSAATAQGENKLATDLALALPISVDKSFVLITTGQTDEDLAALAPEADRPISYARAQKAYQTAATTADAMGDVSSSSYAYGFEGHISELRRDFDTALQLTRRAMLQAQKMRSNEIMYRWEWQTGRILNAQGNKPDAILAYKRAKELLQNVRNDIALAHGNQRNSGSFRHSVGPLYFELADLLLETSGDHNAGEERLAAALREARETVELLKGAELEDFFKDNCVNIIRQQKQRSVDQFTQNKTAVIYIIPLKDRTELLVTLPGARLRRIVVPHGEAEVSKVVLTYRKKLTYFADDEYLVSARLLYDWLIRPLEPTLTEAGIETLAFVPDGSLRSVPMAALDDGEKHLIEKYGIAVTPGLDLMESGGVDRSAQGRLLLSGLSVGRRNFPALYNVPIELEHVRQAFGGGTTLLDDKFVPLNIRSELNTNPSVVHIASHGHFGGTKDDTYLLTFGDNLTLDDVEKLIRPLQFNGKPVELLTLSACQTAEGDDRAALGLAGIAVKAGARSALATLWCVNDRATSEIITRFYQELHDHPEINKAQALRRAQVAMINHPNPAFHHPFLWAPYLIIGNWQ